MMIEHKQILSEIEIAHDDLHARFEDKLHVNFDLDRTLVSFQANKARNGHRWCKYKEGFSADLVRYVLKRFNIDSGCVLDPFAGSGTALFVSSDLGIDSVGIELLPNSAEIIEVRNMLRCTDIKRTVEGIRRFKDSLIWQKPGQVKTFPHLRITGGAFPQQTENELGRYLYEVENIDDSTLRRILRFAAMCVLEEVSYTRKDGQYLRWDYRSGRSLGKKSFNKGLIKAFTPAICAKLDQITADVSCDHMLIPEQVLSANLGNIELHTGSCLDILPKMSPNSFDCLITSPPYCNRYDYTRTYALELAMLGVNEEGIRSLRQAMLSCTVENREKEMLADSTDEWLFQKSEHVFQSQPLLKLILHYLDCCRDEGLLNNAGIARMVRNYFRELTLVIFECARLLKPGAPFVMVNDNVRYQGVHIPLDLILSDIAQNAGFDVEVIWLLPTGKGNSSQQMALHGRQELRKCVYVLTRHKETSQDAKSETCSSIVKLAACANSPDLS